MEPAAATVATPAASTGAASTRAPRLDAFLLGVLALAAALRLAHLAAVHAAPFIGQLAMDSAEYDRWARAIAAGDWVGSGVFFQAPLYPYLLAVIFSLVGHRLVVVYLLQIALAVAGIAALAQAGTAMGGRAVGRAAALLAALYGPFLFYDVQVLKESLAASVVCFLLWALVVACAKGGARRWLVAGLLLGVLALLRENALLLAPFLLPLTGGRERSRAETWRAIAALLAGLVLTLAPVALRNALVAGDPLPTTFQGGVNFWIGNNPEADGTYRPLVPGKQAPAAERAEAIRLASQASGRALGEGAVSRYWLRRALAWAAAHPVAFARLQLRKLGMFWSWYEWPDAVDLYWLRELSPALRWAPLGFGSLTLLTLLGLWQLRHRAAPFAPALLFALGWMVTTVAFFLFSRYRLPTVPALLLVAAVPLAALAAGIRQRDRAWWTGLCLVALALLVPALVRHAPRLELVHDNLGKLAVERGDLASAEREYLAALAVDPRDFPATFELGRLAARRRDWPRAAACFARAVSLAPTSDDAHANLGGAYLAAGRADLAEPELLRALALNPDNVVALQSATLVHAWHGDLAGARALNERLLRVDPANVAAQRLRTRLAGDG
jgi:tetratricopeptide (TPR) repeat protein